MCKFTKIASAVVIAAGTGWISFGQPSFLHAEETKVETKVEQIPSNEAGTKKKSVEVRSTDVDTTTIDKSTVNTSSMSSTSVNSAEGSKVLAQATAAALSGNALQGVSNSLTSADRERIRSSNVDTTELDQTVTQLQADWKAKYGHELSQNSIASVLNPSGMQGGASAGAGASMRNDAGGDQPVADKTTTVMPMNPEGRGAGAPRVEGTPPSGDAAGSLNTKKSSVAAAGADGTPASPPAADGVAKTADSPRVNDLPAGAEGAAARAETASAKMQAGASANMNAGEHATYTVPASGDMQPSSLHLMKESGDWKIDIDDSIDAQRLNTNLNRHLKMVSDMKAQWPDQESAALQSVSQHVAAALTDTSAAVR